MTYKRPVRVRFFVGPGSGVLSNFRFFLYSVNEAIVKYIHRLRRFIALKKLRLDRIEAQRFSHTREAAPMNRQRAERLQQATMLRCWITFVRGETIPGIHLVQLEHVRVACRLRDDRRGRDACRERVASDDAALRHLAVRNLS